MDVKFRSFVLIIVCSLTCMLIACQATPNQSVVIGKSDNALEETFNAAETENENVEVQNASNHAIGMPRNWKDSITSNDNKEFITIDANVIVPSVNSFSMTNVIPGSFNQEKVNELVRYFSNGRPLIAVDETLTKIEIESQIIELQAALIEVNNGSELFGTSEEIQEQIDMLYKQFEGAPETKESIIVDASLSAQPDTNREALDVMVDFGDGNYGTISILNGNANNYDSSFYFYNGNFYVPDYKLLNRDAEGISTTLEEARKKSIDLLKDLGLNEYEVVSVETGIERSNYAMSSGEQGYIATCKICIDGLQYNVCEGRNMNGIVIDESTGNYVYEDTGDIVERFAPTWDVSEIKIGIDDTGITFFTWRNPAEIIKNQNSSISLLPFSDIETIGKQQLKSMLIYGSEQLVYHIDSVELTLAATPQRDRNGYYWFVPAWIINGYCDNSSTPAIDIAQNEQSSSTTFLVLNAIDGSVIQH